MAVRGFTGERLACERGGRIVFTRLDFSVGAGGALVLVGPNGSGKSSLLRMMAGLLVPHAGRMTWEGSDVTGEALAHNARVQLVAHADGIKPALTSLENLRLWAALASGGGDGRRSALDDRSRRALAAFGLAGLAELPARYLSAGQRRRLALCRLLLASSHLWLLDEPRTALDSEGTARLDEAIAAHRAAGGIVVLALHDGPQPAGATILDLSDFRANFGVPPAC